MKEVIKKPQFNIKKLKNALYCLTQLKRQNIVYLMSLNKAIKACKLPLIEVDKNVCVNLRYSISINSLISSIIQVNKKINDNIHIKSILYNIFFFINQEENKKEKLFQKSIELFDYQTYYMELNIILAFVSYFFLKYLQKRHPYLSIDELIKLVSELIKHLKENLSKEQLKRKLFGFKSGFFFFARSYLLQALYEFLLFLTQSISNLLQLFLLIKNGLVKILFKILNHKVFQLIIEDSRIYSIILYFLFKYHRQLLKKAMFKAYYIKPDSSL